MASYLCAPYTHAMRTHGPPPLHDMHTEPPGIRQPCRRFCPQFWRPKPAFPRPPMPSTPALIDLAADDDNSADLARARNAAQRMQALQETCSRSSDAIRARLDALALSADGGPSVLSAPQAVVADRAGASLAAALDAGEALAERVRRVQDSLRGASEQRRGEADKARADTERKRREESDHEARLKAALAAGQQMYQQNKAKQEQERRKREVAVKAARDAAVAADRAAKAGATRGAVVAAAATAAARPAADDDVVDLASSEDGGDEDEGMSDGGEYEDEGESVSDGSSDGGGGSASGGVWEPTAAELSSWGCVFDPDAGPADELLINHASYEIPRSKLRCMRRGCWLNDEVINLYMVLLQVWMDDGCGLVLMRTCRQGRGCHEMSCDHGAAAGVDVRAWDLPGFGCVDTWAGAVGEEKWRPWAVPRVHSAVVGKDAERCGSVGKWGEGVRRVISCCCRCRRTRTWVCRE
eukprot:364664-Chlamydomonas_euryale.AAC.9